MKLAIKIDVDTYRGTRDGVPALAKLLKKRAVPATFLFSFGPDNTGKALRRIFRKGFLKKCLRSNVAGNYGIKTLLYGTLLPAPKIARLCSAQMAAAASDGFECGIHCWDHFKWQDYLFAMRDTEIEAEFSNARAEFEKVFGAEAKCCGAPAGRFHPPRSKSRTPQTSCTPPMSAGNFRSYQKWAGGLSRQSRFRRRSRRSTKFSGR